MKKAALILIGVATFCGLVYVAYQGFPRNGVAEVLKPVHETATRIERHTVEVGGQTLTVEIPVAHETEHFVPEQVEIPPTREAQLRFWIIASCAIFYFVVGVTYFLFYLRDKFQRRRDSPDVLDTRKRFDGFMVFIVGTITGFLGGTSLPQSLPSSARLASQANQRAVEHPQVGPSIESPRPQTVKKPEATK